MWTEISGIVRGATHMKNGKPCQDAIAVQAYEKFVVAAVAAGHGSEACPFSDEGAKAAVELVQEIFADIFAEAVSDEVFEIIDKNKEIRLPKQIENGWKQKVQQLHAQAERELDADTPFPFTLYGTTLLVAVVAEHFLFAMQLGDGDILAVDTDGASWLIEPDYQIGTETYSLCMEDCWRYMKTLVIPPEGYRTLPEMLMLTTDGYANSFATSEGFLKAGSDILGLLQTEGADFVAESVVGWLNHSSESGSGDDISMCVLFR